MNKELEKSIIDGGNNLFIFAHFAPAIITGGTVTRTTTDMTNWSNRWCFCLNEFHRDNFLENKINQNRTINNGFRSIKYRPEHNNQYINNPTHHMNDYMMPRAGHKI